MHITHTHSLLWRTKTTTTTAEVRVIHTHAHNCSCTLQMFYTKENFEGTHTGAHTHTHPCIAQRDTHTGKQPTTHTFEYLARIWNWTKWGKKMKDPRGYLTNTFFPLPAQYNSYPQTRKRTNYCPAGCFFSRLGLFFYKYIRCFCSRLRCFCLCCCFCWWRKKKRNGENFVADPFSFLFAFSFHSCGHFSVR